MKRPIALLVMGIVVVASPAADHEAKAELKKLEGTWEVVSIEVSGMKVDAPKGAPDKAVFSGDKVTFFSAGKEIPTFKELRIVFDEKKSPKVVDLVRGEKESLPCLYELKGDDLILAMPLVPSERKPGELLQRPTSFDTKDKPVMVMVAKRTKK